ncbi:MAG: N(2)-acetyl-L-2,4-diaminobutanoate deacetylase DoeB2 [Desulfuromonadaceae bacterium]
MYKSFNEVVTYAIELRHQLHANPELTWQEFETAATIRRVLDEHGIAWRECARTGSVATLAPHAQGEHIGLRADIDAIPLQEDTGLGYASKNPELMHACGHDGHTATLVAAALWLKQHEDKLPGPVTLIFQPAEEGGHGAKAMLESGCLDGIDFIYGWHNWPAIKFGQALCPDGIVMAGNGTFHITLKGVGGHSSQPEICKDPVLAASAVTLALQQIVSRQIAPQKICVVSVTAIEAPSGLTTIPARAGLHGSIRVSDNEMRDDVAASIKQITEDVAKGYGVEAEVEFRTRYSATINDPDAAHRVRELLRSQLGEDYQTDHLSPVMASEDFSYYLEKIPGAFMLIGSDDGDNTPCHNPGYDFNDRLIEPVGRLLVQLANLEPME